MSTDADKAKALEVVKSCSPEAYVDEFIYDGDVAPLHDAIADALAEERRKVRDQFCAVLSVSPALIDEFGDLRGYLVSLALLSAIDIDEQSIRSAAEESGK